MTANNNQWPFSNAFLENISRVEEVSKETWKPTDTILNPIVADALSNTTENEIFKNFYFWWVSECPIDEEIE